MLNITTLFTSVTQLVGRPVILSCFPSVNEAVLLWTHNGAMLFEDENTSFLPINLNHNLILDNTDIDDSGQYTCRAVLNDEVVEQSITVFVVPGTYLYTYCKLLSYAMPYINISSHYSLLHNIAIRVGELP